MSTALLQTKLRRPSLLSRRVQRPRLVQRLNEGLESGRRITLVSAPAGFGKTTCISEWTSDLEFPVTWLSLDPSDDDPARFVAHFIAALQKVGNNLGREIESVLRSGKIPPCEVISTTIINDILDSETRLLLVLDDLQVIQDPFILQLLSNLVTNLPERLHLVLITREDPSLPLARLRVNNQLTLDTVGLAALASRNCFRVKGRCTLVHPLVSIPVEKTPLWCSDTPCPSLYIGYEAESISWAASGDA